MQVFQQSHEEGRPKKEVKLLIVEMQIKELDSLNNKFQKIERSC